MNYVILDIESTCWEHRRGDREIIEMGAVLIDTQRSIRSEFDSFIRPVAHPVLSDFCTRLTSISQEEVDRAPHFREVLGTFIEWMRSWGRRYHLYTWGTYDTDQLRHDCRVHRIGTEWLQQHTDLKSAYARLKGLKVPVSMRNALEREGLAFIGRQHKGIDDARNMARLFIRYFEDWSLPDNISTVRDMPSAPDRK